MINKANIASPLLDHVQDEGNCFSNTSTEYAELRGRLLIIQAHLKATESAIKMIERMTVGPVNKIHALQRINQISSEYLGAASAAEEILDDINTCLEYLHRARPIRQPSHDQRDALDDELDELLGDMTGDTPTTPIQYH